MSSFDLYKKPLIATALVTIPLFGGFVSGGVQTQETWIWYRSLTKPSWTPPNWVFGPAWTYLYLTMGYASYRIFESTHPDRDVALGLYGTQLALNLLWSPLFFRFKRLGWAAINIVALWASIIATASVFTAVDSVAGALFLPYIAWVTFASSLNLHIWWNNRPPTKRA